LPPVLRQWMERNGGCAGGEAGGGDDGVGAAGEDGAGTLEDLPVCRDREGGLERGGRVGVDEEVSRLGRGGGVGFGRRRAGCGGDGAAGPGGRSTSSSARMRSACVLPFGMATRLFPDRLRGVCADRYCPAYVHAALCIRLRGVCADRYCPTYEHAALCMRGVCADDVDGVQPCLCSPMYRDVYRAPYV